MSYTPPFRADHIIGDLRAALRTCSSLQEASWIIRDVFGSSGKLQGELRVRLRDRVTTLVADGTRKSDLVNELDIPRITIDSWTLDSARPPSAAPRGMPAATEANLKGAQRILPVDQIIDEITTATSGLSDLDAARKLADAVAQGAELIASLREIRKDNGLARLAEGVKQVVVMQDLGITMVTASQWGKLARETTRTR